MDTNMDIIGSIDLVSRTLQGMTISASYDNLDRLLGSLQMLEKIKGAVSFMLQNEPEVRIGDIEVGPGPDTEPEMAPVPVEEIQPAAIPAEQIRQVATPAEEILTAG